MSFTYEQRKRSRGPRSQKPDPTAAPAPSMEALMNGAARHTAAQKGRKIDLDAAMKAKIQHTFGDLSAVKNYTPPAREQLPPQSVPYTGSVTHALSDASPSPAVAGPMQAIKRDKDAQGVKAMQAGGKEFNGRYATKRYADYDDLAPEEWEEKVHTPNWFSKAFLGKRNQTYKVRRHGLPAEPPPLEIEGMDRIPDDDDLLDPRPMDLITDLGDEGKKSTSRKKNRKPGLDLIRNDPAPENDLILNEPPRSDYADDFDLLNSQQGGPEERRNAYDRLAIPTAQNMTPDQKHSVTEYTTGSQGPNAYLRGLKNDLYYPSTEEDIQHTQKEVNEISQMSKTTSFRSS